MEGNGLKAFLIVSKIGALNLRFYRIPVSFKAIMVIKKYMTAVMRLAQVVLVIFFLVFS